MNKKQTDPSDEGKTNVSETIKLTVSEVEPEEKTEEVSNKEPVLAGDSDPVSAIDNLYADRKPQEETVVEENPIPESQVKDQPENQTKMDSIPILTTKQERKSAKSGFWLFVGGLLVGGLVTGGIFGFFINPSDKTTPEVSGVSTPQEETLPPMEEPMPTEPVLEVDYSQYQVKVLNGSGVTGAAATIKDLIDGVGFDQIEVGNAAVSDQQETLVQLKSNVSEAVFEKVKELLSDYQVNLGEPLVDTAAFDVQITVGLRNEE
jgi:hypothetical protein